MKIITIQTAVIAAMSFAGFAQAAEFPLLESPVVSSDAVGSYSEMGTSKLAANTGNTGNTGNVGNTPTTDDGTLVALKKAQLAEQIAKVDKKIKKKKKKLKKAGPKKKKKLKKKIKKLKNISANLSAELARLG